LKVKELIKELQKADPELDIYRWDGEWGCYFPFSSKGQTLEIGENNYAELVEVRDAYEELKDVQTVFAF
jgi:hypothetical protein